MQNSDVWTRITTLYGSQTSPVVLCMQNSVPSIRITSVYGFQPSSVVFGCKTATFGPEQHLSIGPRHHLSFCACKTEWLALVLMGPSPFLKILNAKQRLFDQNNKSVWVTALTCGFWLQNSVFWYRIISLYGSQTSPVTLCKQNIIISIRFTSLCRSQPSSVVFACKTATIGPE